MPIQLNLFNKIIHGELNPVNGPDFRKLNALNELKKHYEEYREKFIVSFEANPSGDFELKDQKSYVFADLLQLPHVDEEDYENDPEVLNRFKGIYTTELPTDAAKIKDPKYRRTKNLITLHFEMEHDWAALSDAKAKYHYLNHLLLKEVDKIKAGLTENVFSFTNEEGVRLFVRNYQNEIVLLIDSCLYQFKDSDKDEIHHISNQNIASDILKLAYFHLESILFYLERHFSKYLDLKAKVPYRHKMITIYEMKPKVDRLLNQISHSISYPLTEIIFESLDKLTNVNADLSYQQLIYLRNFANHLFNKQEETDGLLKDGDLVLLMEEQNFNSLRFVQYLINSSYQEMKGLKSLEERQNFLHNVLRAYSQLPVKNDPYANNLPSLKDQMINWVNEELYLVYRKYEGDKIVKVKPGQNPLIEKNKLPINLSVAQIAYMMKVQKELDHFSINNISDMMRIFCDNTSSVRQKNISQSSMWTKYYNVEHSTKVAVRDMIEKMLEYVNEDIEQGDE